MRVPRLFVDPSQIDVAATTIELADRKQVSQLVNVLRMGEGDSVEILDGLGNIYDCRINRIDPNHRRCQLAIKASRAASGESSLRLTMALPLLKSGRFEWAIEKLTELGAAKIVPITTARSVVRPEKGDGEAQAGKLNRWQAIAREAAEQCERGLIPDVVKPVALTEFLESENWAGGRLLICAERSGAQPLAQLLAGGRLPGAGGEGTADKGTHATTGAASLAVLIGPEGGFTQTEFELASNAGAWPVTLGNRILRTETAAVYTASILISHLDN